MSIQATLTLTGSGHPQIQPGTPRLNADSTRILWEQKRREFAIISLLQGLTWGNRVDTLPGPGLNPISSKWPANVRSSVHVVTYRHFIRSPDRRGRGSGSVDLNQCPNYWDWRHRSNTVQKINRRNYQIESDLSSEGFLADARSDVRRDVTKRLRCVIDDYNAASPGVDCDLGGR